MALFAQVKLYFCPFIG